MQSIAVPNGNNLLIYLKSKASLSKLFSSSSEIWKQNLQTHMFLDSCPIDILTGHWSDPCINNKLSSSKKYRKSICIQGAFPTRTTRMPAFWGYPLPPHDYPYYWPVHIGSQVKTRQSQRYKFKEFAKTSKFWILKQTLHVTYLQKLLDKMCKYEMDLASIVEDTERTRFCPQIHQQTDRRTDKVKPVYPLSTSLNEGYNNKT